MEMFKGFSSLIESMFLPIFTYIDPIKIYIWVMILLIERKPAPVEVGSLSH